MYRELQIFGELKLGRVMIDQIQRFGTLKHVASSFGPALIASSIVILIDIIRNIDEVNFYKVAIFAGGILVGSFFCAHSFYRSVQIGIYLNEAFKSSKEGQDFGEGSSGVVHPADGRPSSDQAHEGA